VLYQHIYKKHKDEGIIKSQTVLPGINSSDSFLSFLDTDEHSVDSY